jgi:hypothetical protein
MRINFYFDLYAENYYTFGKTRIDMDSMEYSNRNFCMTWRNIRAFAELQCWSLENAIQRMSCNVSNRYETRTR